MTLPPRNDAIRPWEDLDTEEQRIEARKIELYVAMVDNLDDHVGRLIDCLKANDLYDNTLIVFMADPGETKTFHEPESHSVISGAQHGKVLSAPAQDPAGQIGYVRDSSLLQHEAGPG